MDRTFERSTSRATTRVIVSETHEWLETDGSGVFASGTSLDVRTRRLRRHPQRCDGAAVPTLHPRQQ